MNAQRLKRTARVIALTCFVALPACEAPVREEGASAARPWEGGASRGAVATDEGTASERPPRGLPSSRDERQRCVVAVVSDGDSFRCEAQGRVRLLLLDAPELSQAPFGARSRDALRSRLIRGDTVWLEFDVQREDRYQRTLAHVWTSPRGGTHLNLVQAREGWAVAVVFPPNVRYVEDVRAAVADARRARRGLWADGGFSCEPIAHKRGDC